MPARLVVLIPFAIVAMIAIGAAWLVAGPTDFESDIEDLGSLAPETRAAAVAKLALDSAKVGDLLGELQGNHDSLTKAGIAEAVAKIGVTPEQGVALRNCLASDDSSTVHAAASILAVTKQGSLARAELAGILADAGRPAQLRVAAATALATCGSLARADLERASRESDSPSSVRYAAMNSLSCTDGEGIDVLAGMAKDADVAKADRAAAVRAIASPGSTEQSRLKLLLDSSDAWLRATAMDALAGTGDASNAPACVTGLGDGVADVRFASLRGLIDLGGESVHRASVIPLMGDADVRVQTLAIRSVGRSCAGIANQVRPALVALLAHASFRVRYEAALALWGHADPAGLAVMQADQASPNQSQVVMATYAANKILGKVR